MTIPLNTKEERAAYARQWRANNKDKSIACTKRWQEKNPERTKKIRKQWLAKNPDYEKDYARKRRQNPVHKLITNERTRQWSFLKTKRTNTLKYVGLTGEEWMDYLMSINDNPVITPDNYGTVWHVDHIFPLSQAVNTNHLKQLFHYLNTQPLLVEENLSKGNRFSWGS